ncbi:MAG: hypothetical protein WCE46_07710 [Methanoregula sp.]|jgi:uncharacterized membrane protein HdeD (DUF308 family)|uniref:hypothetical protein n=1 Tax=Methanoregula sp. TaxID=2052170 RepID=UPI003C74FA5C
MDAKLSCLLKGLIGVIFGGLALVVPGTVLEFFKGIFWLLLVTGIVFCVLIAITSVAEESFLWFLFSAGLIVVGIIEMLFPNFLSFIFVLVVAVLAFYAGYSGISFALTRPRSKYYLVASVIVSSLILLYIFITFVPAMSAVIIMTVVGTFSFVLGLFAIVMGLTIKEGEAAPIPPHVLILKTCGLPVKAAGTQVPSAGTEDQSCGQPDEKTPR